MTHLTTPDPPQQRNGPSEPYLVPNEAIRWDVPTWKRAFVHWERTVVDMHPQPTEALELGATDGGASLFLAGRFGIRSVCSDIGGVSPAADPLHTRFGVRHLMTYADIDATNIAFPVESFDIVIFKSILGSIGGALGPEAIGTAVQEMHRVLRPGGVLLFAENLAATRLHRSIRRRVRAWGTYWHYLKLQELQRHLQANFVAVSIHTTGFGCVAVPEKLPRARAAMAHVDQVLDQVLPPGFKYLAFGHAFK